MNIVIEESAFLQWIGIFFMCCLHCKGLKDRSVLGLHVSISCLLMFLERYKQHCALLFHPKTKPFESDMYIMFSVPNVIAVEII